MITKVITLLMVVSAAFALSSCTALTEPRNQPAPDEPSPGSLQNATPRMAIMDFETNAFHTREDVERYAQANLLALDASYLWVREENAGAVDRMKALNPDLKVVAYINAHTCWFQWEDRVNPDDPANPYAHDWYTATRPYWVWTTTGDTMSTWPGKVMLNITDSACRTAMIDVIVKYHDVGLNRIDGVYWDHFSEYLWVHPDVENEGEPDLDGDGIGFNDDSDEQMDFLAAQEALVHELRAALGDDFIQIFNGARALHDPEFAALGAGMQYEIFPNVGFGGESPMAQALDTTHPNNLFAARNWPRSLNGGPWLILSNERTVRILLGGGGWIDYRLAEMNRIVALITDTLVSYHEDGRHIYGWPEVEFDLGAPVGEVTRDGNTFNRAFANGSVTLTLTDNHPLLPFDFEVIQDGETIQSFVYPYPDP